MIRSAAALAGLPEGATFAAITSRKQSKSFVMQHIAQTLDPAQREATAAYLAGLGKEPAS
jgi:hypothetical protein